MRDNSSDSGDLSLSCSFSPVESDQSDVSEVEDGLQTIEPYQFEPVASVVDDGDPGDEERLHSRNW